MLRFSWLLIGGFLKIFYRVCDAFEAIDATQFTFYTLVTEPVTNGRACFDRLEPDALGGQFIGHAGKSVSALQVHARRSGEIEQNQRRWRRFSVHVFQNRLADMVNVEVHETRFRPKDQAT